MRTPFEVMIVYDLETGGLKVKENPVSEVAMVAVDMQTLEIIDEMTFLIKPYDKTLIYTDDAYEVTKLSVEELEKSGIPSDVAAANIEGFLKKHTRENSQPILCGHNIKKFDNEFLIKFMKDHGYSLEKLTDLSECVDTLKEAQKMFYELPNYSLGTCSYEVGMTIKEAHRALPDTVANANFAITIFKNMRGEGQGGANYVRRQYNFNF